MYNWLVAQVFYEIADLIDIKGESSHRAMAYRRAARVVEKVPGDIRRLMEAGELTSISGVGDALAKKIEEILTTGTCRYLERLRNEVPLSLLDLLELPGVGPRTISTLYNSLGITTLDELETAARDNRLRGLKGFGPKTEENILNGLARLKERSKYWLLAVALPVAGELVDGLLGLDEVERAEVSGSARRRKDRVAGVELVLAVSPGGRERVRQVLTGMELVSEVNAVDDAKVSVVVNPGLQVDVHMAEMTEFVSALNHFTGSPRHNSELRELAAELDFRLDEHGLFSEGGQRLPLADEPALYGTLGLEYVPPELREGAGELEAAASSDLPRLVTLDAVRGDLHVHTSQSDGTASLGEMVSAARARGYQYLAISDHSKSMVVANGLTLDELCEQGDMIARFNAAMDDFRVLHGIEVDIMGDGTLDFPDEVLAGLDWVTASVHSRFRLDREAMTARIVRAMENRHVDAIGHLTGRLLNRRDPYDLDIDRIIEVAQETGTALELNASPDRLDIDDGVARKAREAGVLVVINTDAHAARTLADMEWGVNQARRGWLEPGDVVNCMEVDRLMEFATTPKPDRTWS